jgi:hypothetical protein
MKQLGSIFGLRLELSKCSDVSNGRGDVVDAIDSTGPFVACNDRGWLEGRDLLQCRNPGVAGFLVRALYKLLV